MILSFFIALQYEKIDKGKLAKLDFLKVKELDPNNIQASQGLYRVNQYLPKEEVKAKPVIILSDELKRLEGMKEKGNEIFRKSIRRSTIYNLKFQSDIIIPILYIIIIK